MERTKEQKKEDTELLKLSKRVEEGKGLSVPITTVCWGFEIVYACLMHLNLRGEGVP